MIETGVILNNIGHLEQETTFEQPFSRNSTKFLCTFNNLRLRHIERSQRIEADSLLDETFAFLFQTELQIGDILVKVILILNQKFDIFISL